LRVFYLDGKLGNTTYGEAAGSYGQDEIDMYPDTFRGRTVVSLGPAVIPYLDANKRDLIYENEVLLHEAGHAMGLVNNGIPMVHDHVDASETCRCHSSNSASIMHSGVDAIPLEYTWLKSSDLPRRDFDSDDLADIKAFQDTLNAEASTR
jgi:hypothetical protein